MPAGKSLNERRWLLSEAARGKSLLHEALAAEVVAGNPELQLALEDRVAAAQRDAAAAVQAAAAAEQKADTALQAALAAGAAAEAALHQMASLQAQLLEAADVPEQQKVQTDAVVFKQADLSSLESSRDNKPELLALARKFVQNILASDPSLITGAFLLRKPEGGPAPLVLQCRSEAAKVAVLRAARVVREGGADLQIAARLTRWQQQRKAALKPQLEQLKAAGVSVRMWAGHRLQRQEGRSWVDVPLTSTGQATK